jgi:hypothetical protein
VILVHPASLLIYGQLCSWWQNENECVSCVLIYICPPWVRRDQCKRASAEIQDMLMGVETYLHMPLGSGTVPCCKEQCSCRGAGAPEEELWCVQAHVGTVLRTVLGSRLGTPPLGSLTLMESRSGTPGYEEKWLPSTRGVWRTSYLGSVLTNSLNFSEICRNGTELGWSKF